MEQTFTHTDILYIYPDVKARTLITWSERALIQPLQDAAGRGSSREYSYFNLIEIGIIGELYRYGLPFSTIKTLMNNEKMKKIFRDKAWDTVFWISNGVTGGGSKLEPLVRFARVDNFLKNGGEMTMGANVSAIVINISALKKYVDCKLMG